MITIDDRAGSGALAPLFALAHLPHQLGRLPFGDFAFEGNGSKGLSMIGIEYKKVNDLISCMCDGRYVGHQLPGMLNYFDHPYLIVEGVTRPDPRSGVLQELVQGKGGNQWWRDTVLGARRGRRFMWRDWDGYLTTLEHGKAKVRRTDNEHMTVETVGSLYHWYTHKKWHEHDSLRALHSLPSAVMTLEDKESIVRRVSKEFVGIGIERSLSAHMRFRTPFDFITATWEELQDIPGVGPTVANKIMRQIHGSKDADTDTDDTYTG